MAGLVVCGTQVSYIGQDCREIPEHLGKDCGHFAKRLDLSFNLLRSLELFLRSTAVSSPEIYASPHVPTSLSFQGDMSQQPALLVKQRVRRFKN